MITAVTLITFLSSGAWCEPACQSAGVFLHRYFDQWSHTRVWAWGGSTEVK